MKTPMTKLMLAAFAATLLGLAAHAWDVHGHTWTDPSTGIEWTYYVDNDNDSEAFIGLYTEIPGRRRFRRDPQR